MNKKLLFAFLPCLLLCMTGLAQNEIKKDSIHVSNKEEKNRNVMLNASDASKPREVNIGLPSTIGGTEIFEDGLPVSYYFWPHLAYTSWRGGNSYGKTGLMSLSESALLNGNVGYTVSSETKLGNDTPETHFGYTLNHFGAQKFDLNVSGKIAKGWHFSIGAFQNFDPGSNKLDYAKYQDRTQIYKGALTHRWNEGKGEISLLLKHASNVTATDSYGPFIYAGDGSVKLLDGFDLGHDSYMPSDGLISYQDVLTGDTITRSLYDMGYTHNNEIGLLGKYRFDNGGTLRFMLKYNRVHSNIHTNSLSGLSPVTADQNYSTLDGTPYDGYVQSRYTLYYTGKVNDLLATAEYDQRMGNHALRFGLNQWYNSTDMRTMSSNWAHTVEANPSYLLHDGRQFWGFNTGAEYYAGQENKLAAYFSDDWRLSDKLTLSYGLRLEYYHIDGKSPMNASPDDTDNNRVEGFNLNKKGVHLTRFNYNWLNPIATFNFHYAINRHFGLTGDYLFNRQRARLENFGGQDYANLQPVDVNLGRLGIYYKNDWINVVSALSYIRKTNYKSRSQFTTNINGIDETQTAAINYDIATMGWTTDVVLTPFKGFQLHYLLTLQKPQYKNFDTSLTFSDGVARNFSFSNSKVTGVSEMLMEIDPSYTIDRWKFWLSLRYFSKQYINKPNTLFFNPHWETFGGIDYRLNDHISFSANVINFLNQKGASGSITSADLVTDPELYKNYWMSGSFIRPFTTELSVKIDF